MTANYSDTEIVDIAKQIESCGEAFYDEALGWLKSDEIREVFAWLRDEEKKHADLFERLLAGVKLADGAWRHDESYLGYLRAIVENHVFPNPQSARAIVGDLADDLAAIRYAIGFEKDSILFFHELRRLVAPEEQGIIDKLIAEEQRHVRTLDALLHRKGAELTAAQA